MEKIKVAIVDDHDFFRTSLSERLEKMEGVEVVGQACSGSQFIRMIKNSEMYPDVVLMDIRMKDMDGVQATKLAINYLPSISIIAISLHKEKDYMTHMIEAGAKGFLFKSSDESEIELALNTVYKGKFYFSETVKEII